MQDHGALIIKVTSLNNFFATHEIFLVNRFLGEEKKNSFLFPSHGGLTCKVENQILFVNLPPGVSQTLK